MSSEDTPALSVNASTEPGAPPMMLETYDEPRFANRKNTRMPGYITHSSLTQSVSVTLRDLSSSGARLELAETKGQNSQSTDRIPQRFILNIPIERTIVECDIAWRRGRMLGVRFIAPLRTAPKPQARQLKQEKSPGVLAKMLGFGN